MNRFRIWAGGLHWGQILLLVPVLMFAGTSSQSAVRDYADSIESAASRQTLDDIFGPPFKRLPGESVDQYLARKAANQTDSFEARKLRGASNAKWIRLGGLVVWATSWLTAFLCLWWWFGARVKPEGAQ